MCPLSLSLSFFSRLTVGFFSSQVEEAIKKPYTMCVSTFRLYCKGLVSEEVIRDGSKQIGGFGVAICDHEDNRLFEMKKVLGDEESSHQQVVELAAIYNSCFELGVGA